MKRILTLITALVALYSCEVPPIEPEDTWAEDTQVLAPSTDSLAVCTFNISSANRTKSSISPDEDMIADINIYAYRDGRLVEHVYEQSPSNVTLRLGMGYTYNFYALANTGEMGMPMNEEEVSSSIEFRISNIKSLSESIPMSWKSIGISLSGNKKSISVKLERLAARIGFNIDSSLVNGLKITSVRLCQSASVVRPFEEGGSKVRSSSEIINGDYATTQDLINLNSAKTIYFYALENKQDNLLPDNTDPWQKIPDGLGPKAGLCTYIEAVGEFEDGFLFKGSVTYRFYLGKDNTSDFSIVRNSNMTITLSLTGEGLSEISWKVEPDIEVQPGYAYGYLDEGLHSIDNLYVGERFWYSVDVGRDLITYLGGDLSRCSLALVSENGGSIKFDEYDVNNSEGYFYTRGTCTSKGTGEIWLCDPNGNPVVALEGDFNIQNPYLVYSIYSSVDARDNYFGLDETPLCVINGKEKALHVYLTDNEGYNLNTDYLSGFDLSLFSFEQNPYIESDYDIERAFNINVLPGDPESNGPAATFMISCKNDGTSRNINMGLCNALRKSKALTIDIDETTQGIMGVVSIGLSMQKVTLTMVDNGWANFGSCQLSIKVDNPSNLPLVINGWQVNKTNTDWNALSKNEVEDDVKNNMTLDGVAYITNSYYDDKPTLFGQPFSIYCERNENGDSYVSDGTQMVFPLRGISTDDQIMAMTYMEKGQEALYHLVDVTLPTGRLYSSEVALVDNLEDGSMMYGIIYGDDPDNPGWNNKGMWLYSNGALINKPNTSLDEYKNVTSKHLTDMFERIETLGRYNLIFTYDSDAGQLYARCEEGNIYDIKIDSEFSGTVKGYVKTYPNGTWGSGKDNSCTANIYGGVTGVSVGTSNVSIDGGAIKAGFDAIYAQTFYDSKNWIGSANNYQHRAHPTSFTLNIRLNVSSSSPAGLYPFTILWRISSLPFYHAQDGTTYNPSMTKTIKCHEFYKVTRNN